MILRILEVCVFLWCLVHWPVLTVGLWIGTSFLYAAAGGDE
jgi:hypothetical protein